MARAFNVRVAAQGGTKAIHYTVMLNDTEMCPAKQSPKGMKYGLRPIPLGGGCPIKNIELRVVAGTGRDCFHRIMAKLRSTDGWCTMSGHCCVRVHDCAMVVRNVSYL